MGHRAPYGSEEIVTGYTQWLQRQLETLKLLLGMPRGAGQGWSAPLRASVSNRQLLLPLFTDKGIITANGSMLDLLILMKGQWLGPLRPEYSIFTAFEVRPCNVARLVLTVGTSDPPASASRELELQSCLAYLF